MAETTQTTGASGGSGGTGAQSGAPSLGWRAGLPVELQNNEWLKGFSKVGEFATAALSVKERAERSVVLPGEKSTPEEIQAFDRAFGVPEKEDDYQLTLPAPPEGLGSNDDFVKQLRAAAKAARLNKAQAQTFAENMYKRVYEAAAQAQAKAKEEEAKRKADNDAMMNKAEAELRAFWKLPGEFEANIRAAGEIAKALGGDELMKELDETKLIHKPALLKALAKAAQMMKADAVVKGNGGVAQPAAPAPSSPESRRFTYPWMKDFYGAGGSSE